MKLLLAPETGNVEEASLDHDLTEEPNGARRISREKFSRTERSQGMTLSCGLNSIRNTGPRKE